MESWSVVSDKCVYVYCVESFAHIQCYSECSRAGGAILLNPFATGLFTVCICVIVERCVLYPWCVGVLGIFAVL